MDRATDSSRDSFERLRAEVTSCTICPRLVAYREQIGRSPKKQFVGWKYWAKPVPGFGIRTARLLIVGLAPAPHGGNRTGRVFTGDKSADFLVRTLHRAGFANQPVSKSLDDGLKLHDAYMTAAVKCAPPDNRPTTEEAENCALFLKREVNLLKRALTILCLGKFAYDRTIITLRANYKIQTRIPAFKHGLKVALGAGLPTIFASYHPSPRNTQTGTLTQQMFQSLLFKVKKDVYGEQGPTSAKGLT